MRILYISDRGEGGVKSHVRCLKECLPKDVKIYQIGASGDEEFAGHNGHSFKELLQIRRVIREFKPDIVHLHIYPLMMCLYLKLFTNIPRVASIHTKTDNRLSLKKRLLYWLMRPCFYLPVSTRTWQGFKAQYPNANGEVFYNPIKIIDVDKKAEGKRMIAGIVGRCADVKDWPAYCNTAASACGKDKNISFWGVGVSEEEAITKFGDVAKNVEWKGPQPNGREWIRRMDLFVLTSKREEMPTVVLEAFAERTAICGFIPVGGMEEILEYSQGPLKEVFIQDRDSARLSDIVLLLLHDDKKRNAVIEDGWQILVNHFDAERNCKGQLMEIYNKVLDR